MKRGFHTVTLGCKLNQFDGAAIEGELLRRGFAPEPDRARAEVVVINTCTVTHRADAEARRLVRGVRRHNPRCTLLVTGCYAERDPARVESIGGIDRVFGNGDKSRLGEILDELGLGGPDTADSSRPGAATDRGCDAHESLPAALHFGDRARAFLKIQEGCRLACSYCVIPRVRGASRSVPPEEVERAFSMLASSGYREIVLTGVNSGDWGLDLSPPATLAELLARLLRLCDGRRIRLNSLEPLTVTDEIVAMMASDSRLAPHLQVPLQSGSDEVLRRMRRNYRTRTYLERLERLRRSVPHVGLGADVIVGFPGETERAFEETYEFVRDSPLNYLHVFSWSPRPGTDAAELGDRVDPAEIRVRSARLRALGDRLGFRFRSGLRGRTLEAVALVGSRALTGNFVEVSLGAGSARRGELFPVRIDRVTPRGTSATRLA